VRVVLGLHPILQALLAAGFTWTLTALGAAVVFGVRDVSRRALNTLLGFAAGVMLAASYWSLLAPAIELSAGYGPLDWFPAAAGFLLGGTSLGVVDRILPHLHLGAPRQEAEGIRTPWERSALLVLAITLHNFPEGLAVGVAFGAAAAGLPAATVEAAVILAIGIGLQNFPEGLAVAAPLRREGFSPLRSFWYGQLSAAIEPIAAVLGAAAVLLVRPALPYALSFAAGAMLFVVVEELVPQSQQGGDTDVVTLGTMLGFALMMILDVAFG